MDSSLPKTLLNDLSVRGFTAFSQGREESCKLQLYQINSCPWKVGSTGYFEDYLSLVMAFV